MKTRIRKTKVCMKKIYRSGTLRLEVLIWISVILIIGIIAGMSIMTREEKVLTLVDNILLMIIMMLVLAVWLRISKIIRDEKDD